MKDSEIKYNSTSCLGGKLLLLGIAIFILTGCRSPKEPQSTQEDMSMELHWEDNHVSGTLCEGVTVDADFPEMSHITDYDIISAHMAAPDESEIDAIKAYLFKNDAPEDIEEIWVEEDQMLGYHVKGDKRGMTVYQAPCEKGVYFYDNEAYPWPDLYYEYSIRPNKSDDITDEIELFAHAGKEDLAFMKRDEAIDTVQKYLEEWGIDTLGEPMVFSIKGSDLYQLLEYWNEIDFYDTPITGTPEEKLDCYYMVFDTGYQNIPYTYFEQPFGGVYAIGARLFVRFTDQGIVWMSEYGSQYEVEEILEEHETCISLEQALEKVKAHYENMVSVSELRLEKIYFQYAPSDLEAETGTYTFVPNWSFQMAGEIQGEMTYLDRISINAITGELI